LTSPHDRIASCRPKTRQTIPTQVATGPLEFRTNTQPYIEQNIFGPLRERGGTVYHLDIKSAPGVDIVGDLLDPTFLRQIRGMKIRSAMMCNVLEHVVLRQQICDAVMEVLPIGGYLFVSGPYKYPYHADPIDTMFRPTIAEMHAHFPGTRIIDGAVINSGNWRQWDAAERGRPLGRTMARLLIPFYRPNKWWELARQSPYIFKRISAFGLILRKEGPKSTLAS
jgi:hypothetical protein